MVDINLRDLTDDDLRQLRDDVRAETQRRHTLASIPDEVERLERGYLDAEGVAEGDEWRQPVGGHDAYPKDWTVVHGGKTWISLVVGNVWEPGVSGWREVVDEEDGDGPADFVPPSGQHDAYNTGDRVTFEGEVFESVIDNNVWSPTQHSAGWRRVVEDEDG